MHTEPHQKALALVGRYARIQLRSCQCHAVTRKLLRSCEQPTYHGDQEIGSGCMAAYIDWKNDIRRAEHEKWPDNESEWQAVFDELEFCRPCRIAFKTWRHRKAMHRRRATVLGSMKRLGLKHQGVSR